MNSKNILSKLIANANACLSHLDQPKHIRMENLNFDRNPIFPLSLLSANMPKYTHWRKCGSGERKKRKKEETKIIGQFSLKRNEFVCVLWNTDARV